MSKTLHVVIVGGGVAGLTLANALERAGIDFTLLEGRHEIAPQVGASIGMFPNGERVLDQLGVYEEILPLSVPLEHIVSRYPDGTPFVKLDAPQLSEVRSGYISTFFDRQGLLAALYDRLEDKSHIKLNKRVTSIEHTDEKATALCSDGSRISGDVIVGADGVHSIVRREMWKHDEQLNKIIPEEEKDRMMSEYRCFYSICKKHPSFDNGDINVTYGHDESKFTITGKDNLYVFYLDKLPKQCRGDEIPRYTMEDAAQFVKDRKDNKFTPTATFGEIFEGAPSYALTAIEEADFEHWTSGRLVCLGDAVHKVTPDIGQGGNGAIESCAALANALKRLHSNFPSPSLTDVEDHLLQFQKKRRTRIKPIMDSANMITRLRSLKSKPMEIMAYYVLPNAGDYMTNLQFGHMVGAELIEYLPVPPRSLLGTMPYNPFQGTGYLETVGKRALWALPLLFIGLVGGYALFNPENLNMMAPRVIGAMKKGSIDGYELPTSFYGIKGLDEFWRRTVAIFTPSLVGADESHRLHMISFLLDCAPILLIMMYEGIRRSNMITFARASMLWFLIAQKYSIAMTGGLYCFIHYIQSPIYTFAASDMRLANMASTKTLLPTLLLSFTLPTLANYYWPDVAARLSFNYFWQMSPLWVFITHWIMSALFVKDTTQVDRLKSPTADTPYLRDAVITVASISAVFFNYVRYRAWTSNGSLSLANVFFGDVLSSPSSIPDLTRLVARLLRYDEIFGYSAFFVWLGYLLWDLEAAKMAPQGTILKVAAAMTALVLLVGPGPALLAGWYYRETVIANPKNRHWGALIEGRVKAPVAGFANDEVKPSVAGHANGHANGHVNGKA